MYVILFRSRGCRSAALNSALQATSLPGGRYRVAVERGKVASVEYLSSATAGLDSLEIAAHRFPTIEDLFERAEGALYRADEVTVRYDSARSYPRYVAIDYDVRHVDDEVALKARLLMP